VITASHVVRGRSPDEVVIEVGDARLAVRKIESNAESDLAVLFISDDAPPSSVVAASADAGAEWIVTTRPQDNDPQLSGTVTAASWTITNKGRHQVSVIQLEVAEFLQDYRGYSGSAVRLKSRPDVVLGVLCEQVETRLGLPGAGRKPATNVLYAVPVSELTARFDFALPIAAPQLGPVAPSTIPETDSSVSRAPRPVGRRTVIVALLAVVVLAVGVTVAAHDFSGGSTTAGAPVNQTPVPASSTSPPLAVLSVGEFRTASTDGREVLPGPVTLTPTDISTLNHGTSDAFTTWYAAHGGVAQDSAYSNITVRGNESQSVRITDMKVIKQCSAPFDGTLLHFYTQGGDQETYQVGFDLDAPDPVAQEMADTSARGLHPTGQDYFAVHTIVVDPGQTITLTVGGFTKDHACTFRVRIIEATSHGPVWQNVDEGGKPFAITATATPPGSSDANARYRVVYVQDAKLNWQRTTP
jgi:hypothetical protein